MAGRATQISQPRCRLRPVPALVFAFAVAACTAAPTGVTRLSDGLLKAATVQEAEAYCRKSGDPTRLTDAAGQGTEPGVLFRCD